MSLITKKQKWIIIIIAELLFIGCIVFSIYFNEGDVMKPSEKIENARINHKIVLVDFWAEGCKPCVMITPHMNYIEKEYPNVKVLRIDINSEDGLHIEYGIRFVPTVIIFYEGYEFVRLVGYHSLMEYVNYIDIIMNPNENMMIKFDELEIK